MTPQISVCLPIFNAESFIEAAVESILQQTFPDLELLISDDGSTDRTQEIVLAYAAQDKRIRYWRNEKNLGAVRNYNYCFVQARGAFIKPFAADDIMFPNQLEAMHKAIREEKEIALVACARQIIDGQGGKAEVATTFSKSEAHNGKEIQKECLKRFVHVFNLIGEPSCVLFKKEDAGNGFDVNYYHMTDLDMWIGILKHGNLFYIAEPLCSYRKHENSTTNNNFKSLYYMLDFMRILDKNKELCDEIYGSRELAYSELVEHLGRFIYKLTESQLVQTNTISANLLDSRSPLLLQSGIKQDEAIRPETLSDQEYFRQLALFALLRLGQTSARLDETYQGLNMQVKSYEEQLSSVYKSTSWKSTKILRDLAGIFRQK